MKRALAERAKQSGLPNGVGVQEKSLPAPVAPPPTGPSSSVPVTAPSSSTNTNRSNTSSQQLGPNPSTQPLPKIPKLEVKNPSPNLSSITKTTTKTTPAKAARSPRPPVTSSSPRPKKRARESLVKLEEEDEDDSGAASFYLRHQNRALASELRSVKYQLVRLEREREHRRTQCLNAVKSLNTLYSKWGQVEAAMEEQRNPETTKIVIPDSDAPLSTGSGKSVEWIGALINSLARLGTTKSNKRGNNDDSKVKEETSKNDTTDGDRMEVEGEEQANPNECEEDAQDETNVEDIMNIAENMSKRVGILQSWIWTILKNVEKSDVSSNGELKDQAWSPPSTMELQNQLSQVEAENVTLQEHIKELTRSRDEMVESDRRVRRGLYRLAAGRVNLKEVLKAVATADEDKESAAAWMESNLSLSNATASGSSLPSSTSGSQPTDGTKLQKDDGKNVASSKEVEQLKKQIADLNTIATSRDEQIKKVSFANSVSHRFLYSKFSILLTYFCHNDH